MLLFSFQRQKCICSCSPTTLKDANTTTPSAVIFSQCQIQAHTKNFCVAWSKTKPRPSSSFHQWVCALGSIKPVALKPGTLHSLAVSFSSQYHLFSPPLPSNTKQPRGTHKDGEVFSAHLSLCHSSHIALPHLKPLTWGTGLVALLGTAVQCPSAAPQLHYFRQEWGAPWAEPNAAARTWVPSPWHC